MATRSTQIPASSGHDLPALTISPEKVCFVVLKAREFDLEAGSNPSDDKMLADLEDHGSAGYLPCHGVRIISWLLAGEPNQACEEGPCPLVACSEALGFAQNQCLTA